MREENAVANSMSLCDPLSVAYPSNLFPVKRPPIIFSPPLTFSSSEFKQEDMEISYIDPDPRCSPHPSQFTSWKAIPNGTFDYIWFESCPLYGNEQMMRNILLPALDKLKEGGSLFFAQHPTPFFDARAFLEELRKKIRVFTVSTLSRSQLPFDLRAESRPSSRITEFYSLTKTAAAGGRRLRKTRKARRFSLRNTVQRRRDRKVPT